MIYQPFFMIHAYYHLTHLSKVNINLFVKKEVYQNSDTHKKGNPFQLVMEFIYISKCFKYIFCNTCSAFLCVTRLCFMAQAMGNTYINMRIQWVLARFGLQHLLVINRLSNKLCTQSIMIFIQRGVRFTGIASVIQV